jgi:hypothetical protein
MRALRDWLDRRRNRKYQQALLTFPIREQRPLDHDFDRWVKDMAKRLDQYERHDPRTRP